MQKISRLLLILTISTLGGGSAAAGETWVPLQPPASVSFSVLMPAGPQKIKDHDEWRAVDGAGGTYTVVMGYYTEPRITQPEAFMRMMVGRLAVNTRSKVVYTWFFKQQYAPACEFKLMDRENHRVAVGRYFLIHQWFYLLDYTTSDKSLDQKGVEKFFGSFRIINPQLEDLRPGS